MLRYLDEVIRPLVLILPTIIGHINTCKDKDGDHNENNSNKLMSLHIDGDKLLEKQKKHLD